MTSTHRIACIPGDGIGVEVTAAARGVLDRAADRHVRPSGELRAALATADVVVIAAPLPDETRGLFGHAEFAAVRPGARLINVGRGAIVDHVALLRRWQRGQPLLNVIDKQRHLASVGRVQ